MDRSHFDKLKRAAQKGLARGAVTGAEPQPEPQHKRRANWTGHPPPQHPKVATDTDAVPDELQEEPHQEQHLRSAASLPWQERRERSDAAARSNSEYVESAPHERLAALQSVIQTAISEDWQHHACVPQDGYVHCVAGDACNKPSSYAGVAKATCDLEQHTDTYLDRSGLEGAVQQVHGSGQLSLSGAFAAARATTEAPGAGADAAVVAARLAGVDSEAHDSSTSLSCSRPETSNITARQPCAVHGVVGFVCCHGVPLLALYCNMRTAEQFVYYLLAVALLLRQCCGMLHMSHLYIDFACQFQWASGKGQAPTWLPSISLSANMAQLQLRGVRGPHEQRMAAAKLKCMELETAHALEKETHLGSAEGESPLIARGLVLLVEGQITRCVWHGKGAEYAECSGYRTQVEQLTNDVHELGLQRDHMGQSDKARAQQATPSRQILGSASQRGSTLPGAREW
ncbi:hypothetical protein QJQ45_019377 [Haematococcus lacustris]|nr:hypothetical protein QJQ45_019377 [Haematococcus lacustris]